MAEKSFVFKPSLNMPVQFVKGVGPHYATLLKKMDLRTAGDLLYHFPHRYLDYRQIDRVRSLTPGKNKCIVADVVGGAKRSIGTSRKKIYEMIVSDGTGIALITWFHFNESYLQKIYPPGKKLFIAGECQFYGAQKQFVHPEIEEWDEENLKPSLVPVYPLSEGLYQRTLRKIIAHVLETHLDFIEDCPLSVRSSGEVRLSLREAILYLHRPPPDADLQKLLNQNSLWHQRVAYDELFFLQLGLALRKQKIKKEPGLSLLGLDKNFSRAKNLLPFLLTGAQEKVLNEIACDLAKPQPMNRLLQGDVGSGKTLVAFLSALIACENGHQATLMVPTEILAQQHFKNLYPLALKLDIPLACLTSSTPKKERDGILKDLQENRLRFLIGTHALIQNDVFFSTLAYIIIDEQHRFGVLQRAALKDKGFTRSQVPGHESFIFPHILVMSATPIPRTLAMSVYGDLDVSAIDELPPGRKPVMTRLFFENRRVQAYELVESELKKGHQAYFIYPLIEESEKIDLKDAQTMAEKLKTVFPKYRVGLLHGKMPSAEKETIMEDFKKNQIHILVSTTVIEVGVDVPNATVMVVEHAERFGLSQLHQLRGRVGRGQAASYCLLMAGYAQSEETRYRLKVMEKTNDGFRIAEEDLKIRGPGDFLGTRQAGLPPFRLANLVQDGQLLSLAQKRAFEIIELDPLLEKEEHQSLKKILQERWEGKLALAEVC